MYERRMKTLLFRHPSYSRVFALLKPEFLKLSKDCTNFAFEIPAIFDFNYLTGILEEIDSKIIVYLTERNTFSISR